MTDDRTDQPRTFRAVHDDSPEAHERVVAQLDAIQRRWEDSEPEAEARAEAEAEARAEAEAEARADEDDWPAP
jgi:hypothetical protein